MKKRLLSAALAFAMVLTMIPATMFTAFAAVTYRDPVQADPDGTGAPGYVEIDSNGDVVKTKKSDGTPTAWFYTRDASTGKVTTTNVEYNTASDNTTKRVGGKWYWLWTNPADSNDKCYFEVTRGIVIGTGKSGSWYPDIDTYLGTSRTGKLPSTSFTLINTQTMPNFPDPKNAPTTLTIDVNGNTLNLGTSLSTLPDNFSRLTITDTRNSLTDTYTGSISALVRDTSTRSSSSGYSNLTVVLSNISVPSISLQGGGNTVTLNHVAVAGDITLDGTTNTNGKMTYPAQTLNINTGENETRLSTTTSVGGDITVTGDGSKLILNNTVFNGGGQSITVNSNGGSVNVDGRSSLGNITVGTRDNSGATNTPPSVIIDSGNVGTIARRGNDSTKANSVTINRAATVLGVNTPNGNVTMNQGKVSSYIQVGGGSVTLNGPVVVGSDTVTTTPPTASGLLLGDRDKVTLSITGTGSDISAITAGGSGYNANKGSNIVISKWPTGRDNNFGALYLGNYKGRGVTGGVFTYGAPLKDSGNELWFSKDLQLIVDMGSPNWALYGKTEMARAISDITSTAAGGTGGTQVSPATAKIYILSQGTGAPNYSYPYTVDLMNGGINWATVAYSAATSVILPDRINGYDISIWISGDSNGSVPAGKAWTIPKPGDASGVLKLYANDVATTVVKAITNVAVSRTFNSASSAVNNQNVRVSLSGNVITITGAIVPAPGGTATIELDLTTDALATNNPSDQTGAGGSSGNAEQEPSPDNISGYQVLRNVEVFYDVETKTIGFTPLQEIPGGAIVNELGELVLNNGTGAHYTVKASLVESAPTLRLAYTDVAEIHATLSGNLAKLSQTDKDRYIDWLDGSKTGNASFRINGNRAVLEAINAAQATITSDKTVENWRDAARNYVWKNGNSFTDAKNQPDGKGKGKPDYVDAKAGSTGYIKPHTGNYTTTGEFAADAAEIADRYAEVYIVPYLMVNATNLDQNGVLTATLSVYYRVDVSAADRYHNDEYYTVQAGKPLSALTGDMATFPLLVKFNSASSPFASATHMHQDGKYVYQKGADTPDSFAINHAGPNGNGLGTIVLNTTPGTVRLTSTIVNRAPTLVNGVGTSKPAVAAYAQDYDNLQAAVDDTVPGIVNNTVSAAVQLDTITILGTHAETDCSINVSGVARKFLIVSKGNHKVTSNTANVDVQTNDGFNYAVELKKDNVPAGTVAITVSANASGTASVNKSSAKAGETVTVTVLPVNGVTPSSVTIRTNTGIELVATPTGVPNEYSFTVPTGVTSITVTPNFGTSGTTTRTEATIAVANASNGSAVTSTNKAVAGTTVTVSAVPSAGYRTMGVTLSSGGNAVRQSADSFTFVVPSNVTSVIVTPSFDRDNGTIFGDVWSTSYYSDSVAWAVRQGITNGTSTYAFSPSQTITRAQMMTFLWRAAGRPSVSGVYNPFVDVTASMDSDFYSAILWAVSKGITNGVDSTHFGPNQSVTRAQAVSFLYRYAGSPPASAYTGFVDAPSTEYYAKAVSWAAGKGITNGKTTTTFGPSLGVQRAEAVTFLYRYASNTVA